MSTLRKHKTSRFTTVSNSALEDERLSFKAKGLLVYLLSKPDGWQVKYRHIMGVGPDGEVAVRSALNELEEAGYLRREKVRRDDGTYENTSHLYETPQNADTSGSAGSSGPGKPSPGSSSLGESRLLVSTEVVSTEKKTPSPPSGGSPESVEDGGSLFNEQESVSVQKPSLDEEFEDWWQIVPRKVSKGNARKAFAKARKAVSADVLMRSMVAFADSVKDRERQFIPHPASWLNGERWEDEIESPDDGWDFGSGPRVG